MRKRSYFAVQWLSFLKLKVLSYTALSYWLADTLVIACFVTDLPEASICILLPFACILAVILITFFRLSGVIVIIYFYIKYNNLLLIRKLTKRFLFKLIYCYYLVFYVLLGVVAQSLKPMGQTFEQTTPIISFVPWSPKCSQRTCITHLLSPCSLQKSYHGFVSFTRRIPGPNNVGSCCVRLYAYVA